MIAPVPAPTVNLPAVSAIRDALQVLVEPNSVVEMRVLKTDRGTVSGYFNDPEEPAARAA